MIKITNLFSKFMLKKVTGKKLFMKMAMEAVSLNSRRESFWGVEELPERLDTISNNIRELQEYLLVIRPGSDVFKKVAAEKENFSILYQPEKQVITTPHISVAGFLAKESMEETLIRWIQRICIRLKSFTVTLNNYSGFPPHTVYLRVQDPEPFLKLAKQLRIIDEYIQSNGCPAVKLVTRPHLCIGKQLPEIVYEKAIQYYSKKIFCESFTAGELMLLRKRTNSDEEKVINIFRLQPQENNLFN